MSSTTPNIRQATSRDAAELARLRWDFSPDEVAASGQSFAEFARDFELFLRDALDSRSWSIWVSEQQERLIANIYVYCVPKVPRPGRFGQRYGYVTNVYVEPDVRNAGIGSALLRQVIAWACAERLELLLVWPSEESVRFYKRAGFIPSPSGMELDLEASYSDQQIFEN
jgi:GNAT superfamily N-acetyltransferase